MPKRVDHDERRSLIADALVRVAVRDGLHNVGMRGVAEEAGISLRLVQYYAQSKEHLLLLGLRRVRDLAAQRVSERLAGLPPAATIRERIEEALLATLPFTPDASGLYRVYNQYFALSLTDPGLAEHLHEAGVGAFETWIKDELHRHHGDEQHAASRAAILVALTAGLGNGLLGGQRTARQARTILRAELDSIFGHLDPDSRGTTSTT